MAPVAIRRSETATTSGELLDLIEAGRPEAAMELVYNRYRTDVLRFVRFKRSLEPAEDVCREAWLAGIWRRQGPTAR